MDYSARMGFNQGIASLHCDVEHLLRFDFVPRYQFAQASALNVLHHDVGVLTCLADLVDRNYVGMIER